jgi:16S rRNA (guanine527-N7)-methyltransferase
MQEHEVIKILNSQLQFSEKSITKLKIFKNEIILANKKHNFISKSTENEIWLRHILDSAQIIRFINFEKGSLSDLGSGGGFPGLVLAIFNESSDFHVKLYEKSPVKRAFLEEMIAKLSLKATVFSNVYGELIDSNYIVCRAFKKLESVLQVSREIVKKPHRLIVLKGKNAQEEINKAFKSKKYSYKLERSMTDENSKILIMNFI